MMAWPRVLSAVFLSNIPAISLPLSVSTIAHELREALQSRPGKYVIDTAKIPDQLLPHGSFAVGSAHDDDQFRIPLLEMPGHGKAGDSLREHGGEADHVEPVESVALDQLLKEIIQ